MKSRFRLPRLLRAAVFAAAGLFTALLSQAGAASTAATPVTDIGGHAGPSLRAAFDDARGRLAAITAPFNPVVRAREVMIADTKTPARVKRLAWAAQNAALPAVKAQAIKDLAQHFTGTGDTRKTALGVDLYRMAAGMGNIQARRDLAYLQYYGRAGLPQNRESAIAAMRAIDSKDARAFVASWTGDGAPAIFTVRQACRPWDRACPYHGRSGL